MKSSIGKIIKKLAGPVIILALILAVFLGMKFYKPAEEEPQVIETKTYSGDGKTAVLENDELLFEMDPDTTQFTVTDKKNDKVWYSNPPDADKDPLALKLDKAQLKSTLLLTYSTREGVDTLFNNFDYSIDAGTYEIEQGEDYIKVCYSIGKFEETFVIPTTLSVERMDELTANMDKSKAKKVRGYYKKYDINDLGRRDNKEELLELYPSLADEPLYVLRDKASDNVKRMIAEEFGKAGYTYEDYLADMGESEEGEASELPVFNVNVVYRLDGNKLTVEVPMEEIEYRENYPIYYLTVLPYFGAGSTEDEGYMLVPEGGGALINFNNGKVAQNSYYANLYGWDYAQYRDAVVHETNTYFNAFGIAHEGSSFLCVLEDGAPYAGINADISGKTTSYNSVSAQYTMLHREVYEMGDRYESKIYMYEDALPKEPLVLSYHFLESDSYADMAAAYRSYLQDEFGELFTECDDAQTPAVIEIVGAVDKVRQVAGIPVSRPLALTTFDEAEDIIGELLQNGVGNMSVKLSGWFNGGIQQKILNKIKVISDLGGKGDLKKLASYAKENGVDLYLNGITNYAYDSGILDGFLTFTQAARLASKKVAEIHPYSTVTYADREGQEPHYLLKASLISKMIDNLVKAADKYDANVSFEDVGVDLSSDFNKKMPVSRQSELSMQVEQMEEIRDSGKKIMINMGNNYAVAHSDIVTNMNLHGSEYTILDTYVPVYQMALHGYVDYTGESLNLTQNEEEELLLSAEYGAGLAFTLMDESAFTLQNTLYTEYFGAEYETWRDRLVETYTRYNNELGHTFSQKMVGHEKLSETFSCTEYEDGTKVYVNYGYDDVKTPEGETLPARDYLVQKGS